MLQGDPTRKGDTEPGRGGGDLRRAAV